MNHHHLSLVTLALLASALSLQTATASAPKHHPKTTHRATAPAPETEPAPLAASADGTSYEPVMAFTHDFAARIKPGTALSKVEALIGQPGNPLKTSINQAYRNLYWIGQHHSNFSVSLDINDHVIGWNLIDKDNKSWGMDDKGRIAGPY